MFAGLLGFNGVFLLALSSPVVVAAVAWARSKRGPSAKPSVAMESLARVDLLRVFAGVVAPPLVCLAVLR